MPALLALPVGLALAVLIWLSIRTPALDAAGSGAPWTLDAYLRTARTYLIRSAFLNTLYSGFTATLLAGGLARLLYPAVIHGGRPRRVTLVLVWAGLLTPVAPALLVWREVWMPTLWLTDARQAVIAAGLVLGWRLTPYCLILLWSTHKLRTSARPRPGTPWPVILLLCGWLAAIDLPVVYLLTQGEPFNAAHTAATWAWQQAWVARHWADAAAMLVGFGLLTLLAWRLARGATSQRWRVQPKLPLLPGPLAAGMAALVIPLPIWLGMAQVDWPNAASTLRFVWRMGAGGWLVNTLLVMAGAGLMAWGLLRLLNAHGASDTPAARRVGAWLPALGMIALAVGWLPIGWLHAETDLLGRQAASMDSRVVLALVFGLTAALILGGLVNRRARSPVWAFGAAAILAQSDLALNLSLALPNHVASPAGLLGASSVLYLARVPAFPHAPFWLLVCAFVFFGLASGAATILSTFDRNPSQSRRLRS